MPASHVVYEKHFIILSFFDPADERVKGVMKPDNQCKANDGHRSTKSILLNYGYLLAWLCIVYFTPGGNPTRSLGSPLALTWLSIGSCRL